MRSAHSRRSPKPPHDRTKRAFAKRACAKRETAHLERDTMIPDTNIELIRLLVQNTPFIDLRSPGEFISGAVPGAVNLPLLNDDERHQIGLTYKLKGKAAAVELGHSLVAGDTRAERIGSWQTFAAQHADVWLYCWRGGMRSEIAQTWLADQGLQLPRVPGGFKALRRLCTDTLISAPTTKQWLVVAGRTGSGKTTLLNKMSGSIDLEGLANHRGSAFGAQMTDQPPPIAFENALATEFLKHSTEAVVVEDEGRTIGRLAIPAQWHALMQQAPLLLLEVDLDTRCANICREYVDEPLGQGLDPAALHSRYENALQRIEKRLGNLRKKQISQLLDAAFAGGDHQSWIERLLSWYYDPMYDYQLRNKIERVAVRGSAEQLLTFIDDFHHSDRRSA